MRSAINAALKKLGYRLIKWEPYPFAPHLTSLGISLVFDVGANVGQYGQLLRKSGYAGRIVSFETVTSAYTKLTVAADRDPLWDSIPIALGSITGRGTINVNRNSDMSSLRTLSESHAKKHGFEPIGTQTIDVVRL